MEMDRWMNGRIDEWIDQQMDDGNTERRDEQMYEQCLISHSPILLMQVYKVLYPYTPRKEDELELVEDDYVFVSASDQGQTGNEYISLNV